MVAATVLLGDETAGLLASWSFCASFLDPNQSLKGEKKRKRASYNSNSNTSRLAKGRFNKRQTEQNNISVICRYGHHPLCFGDDACLQHGEFSSGGQGKEHTAVSDGMKNAPVSGGHCTPVTLTNYLGIKVVLSLAATSVCPPLPAKTNFQKTEMEAAAEHNC